MLHIKIWYMSKLKQNKKWKISSENEILMTIWTYLV